MRQRTCYWNILGLLTLSLLAHCGDPAVPSGDAGNTTFDYRKLPRSIATIELSRSSARFDVEEDTVVIAEGKREFRILDISNPLFPKSTFQVDWAESVVDVCQRSPWLYVLDRKALHVLGSDTPNAPPLGSLPFPEGSDPRQMLVGNFGIVAIRSGLDYLLWFVDVSDPAQPRKVSEVPIGGRIYDMAVDGNLLLVGTENGTVFLDVGDIENVETLSSIGQGRYVAAANGFAYVSIRSRNGAGGLVVLNIQDPRNPIETASTLTPRGAGPMVLQANQLFIRVDDHVDVINVLDRRQPRPEGSIVAPGEGWLHVEGSRLWTSGYDLEAHEMGEVFRVPVLGEQGIRAWGWRWLQLEGGRLFGVDARGFFVLNVLDPQLPTTQRRLPVYPRSGIAHVDGMTAFFHDEEQVYITHLETGQLLSTVTLDDRIVWLKVFRDYLCIVVIDRLTSRYDVQLYDISNLREPRIAGRLRREGVPRIRLRDVELVDNNLYVLSDVGIDVFDISRPFSLELISQLDVEAEGGMTIHGEYLYLSANRRVLGLYPLLTISLRQPEQLRIVSSVDLKEPLRAAAVEGDFLYSTSRGALWVYDISQRANPRPVARQAWLSSNSAQQLLIGNGFLYAFMDEGLEVLPLHAPER